MDYSFNWETKMKMTDEEFEFLKQKLELNLIERDRLQELYKSQTGKRWVPEIRVENPIWRRH